MEYLNIEILKKELGYCGRGLRSIKKWLDQRRIAVFKIGKHFCVIKAEYENAKMQQPLKYLKEKYGDNLPEVLNANINFYSECTTIEDKQKNKTERNYQPTSTEQDFLNRLLLTSSTTPR